MRLHVARDPTGKRRAFGQARAEVQIGVGQGVIDRRHEGAGDPLVFGLGQLRRAVLEVLPFLFDFLGKRLNAQRLDQNLDPRLVLVVTSTMAVVHPQHGLDVGQQMLPRQAFADL
ncbi:hypothetical protein D3C81_1630480 [compost metagenome]